MSLKEHLASRRSQTSSRTKLDVSANNRSGSGFSSNSNSTSTLQKPQRAVRITSTKDDRNPRTTTQRAAPLLGYRPPKRHLYRTSIAQKVRTLRRRHRCRRLEPQSNSPTPAEADDAASAIAGFDPSWQQAGFANSLSPLLASIPAAETTCRMSEAKEPTETYLSSTSDAAVSNWASASVSAPDSNPADDAGGEASRSTRAEGRGRNAPRSRNGCWTCRTKKVKCDEKRPKCLRCIRLRLLCDYEPRDKRQSPLAKSGAVTGSSQANILPTTTATSTNGALVTSQPWLLNLPSWNGSSSIPMQLSVAGSAACSLELTSSDHEAIRHYRTTFARRQHTKNSDYSVYAVIFTLAERDPLVMRGLLALGGREIQYRRTGSHVVDKSPGSWTPLGHYSAALRMMADTIGTGEGHQYLDLDVVLAALHLMLLYELKYGDPECAGWTNHLNGAALIIQHRCSDWPAQVKKPPKTSASMNNALVTATQTPPLSLFSARMLIYIASLDASGSTFGLGGQVNKAMHNILYAHDPCASPIDSYLKLHRFSHSLFRTVWGENYPQRELIDDIENRDVFGLVGSCYQLRYLVAEIANLDGNEARQRVSIVQDAINFVGEEYAELLEVAAEISTDTDSSRRVTTNMRAFVPHYYAILLEFLRMRRGVSVVGDGTGAVDECKAESYISIIMDLARQTYKHQGPDGLLLVTYPLFVAALETDSHTHRDWVLARFHDMIGFGRNVERAYRFLVKALDMQAQLGYKIDVRKQFRFGDMELFVV